MARQPAFKALPGSSRWPVSGRVTASVTALVLVVIAFTITTNGSLLQAANITSILNGSAQLGIIAIGVTLLMIGGEYDLSVGQTFVLSGMVCGLLLPHVGQLAAALIALLVALAVGLFNGFAVITLRLPSFIATLGSFYALSGVILLVTGGTPVTPTTSPALFGYLDGAIGGTGLKLELGWWLGIAAVVGLILQRTRFGNHVFAVGGDSAAAANNGVLTKRVRYGLFLQCALLAGFAGLVAFADIGTVAADSGSGLQLDAIAAAVIGGASLFGGIGGIVDGVIGALFLGLVSAALVLSGASVLYYQLFVGLVLVVTVSVHLRASSMWRTIAGRLSLRKEVRNGGDPLQ